MSNNGTPSTNAPPASAPVFFREPSGKDGALAWAILEFSESTKTDWARVAAKLGYKTPLSARSRYNIVKKQLITPVAISSSTSSAPRARAKKSKANTTNKNPSKVSKTTAPRKTKTSEALFFAVDQATRDLNGVAGPETHEDEDKGEEEYDDMQDGEFEYAEEELWNYPI